jgi:hypothetical protein
LHSIAHNKKPSVHTKHTNQPTNKAKATNQPSNQQKQLRIACKTGWSALIVWQASSHMLGSLGKHASTTKPTKQPTNPPTNQPTKQPTSLGLLAKQGCSAFTLTNFLPNAAQPWEAPTNQATKPPNQTTK